MSHNDTLKRSGRVPARRYGTCLQSCQQQKLFSRSPAALQPVLQRSFSSFLALSSSGDYRIKWEAQEWNKDSRPHRSRLRRIGLETREMGLGLHEKKVRLAVPNSDAQTALLASIVDSSDDAIMAKTPDGTITSWNRGAEHVYGYTAKEIIGQPVKVLIHPDRPDEMDVILQRIRNGERVEHYETTRVRKDGKTISVSLTVSPILDQAGTLVGVSSIARDITERKRVEEQARETSQYARSLIEASLDPLVTISPDGKITDVNEATVKVTGVQRETLIGTDFSDYFTEPSQARAGYVEVFFEGPGHGLPPHDSPQERGADGRPLQRVGVQRSPRERARGLCRRPRHDGAEAGVAVCAQPH